MSNATNHPARRGVMTGAASKLAVYAGVLVGVMVLSTAGGSLADPIGLSNAEPVAEHEGMDRTGRPLPGLAVASDDYRLVASTDTARAGEAMPFSFRIVDEAGVVTDFDVEHTKRMHLVVVRRDLGAFLHEHPTMGRDGIWTASLTLPTAGTYRVYADFVVDGDKHTLGTDLFAPGPMDVEPPLPTATRAILGDGYTVDLDGEMVAGEPIPLEFTIRRHGRVVDDVPSYLGARGHLVVLRSGDLAYLHVHAEDEHVAFETEFPTGGRYRLFLQFRHAGEVRTATFAVDAEEAIR